MNDAPVYLDYNATTPLDPAVTAAMAEYLGERFGNPSSSHRWGRPAREAVETARARVAALLNAEPAEIVFTSGGSEANNLALKGVAFRHCREGAHLVISAVEHPSVSAAARWLAGEGFAVTEVPVDRYGQVDPDAVAAALRADTLLVSVMLANNEVGTLQPVRRIADVAHARGVLVHCDAAQAVGKVPVDVEALGVDLLSVAGHKFYGPKGVGALYVRSGVQLTPLVHGSRQERGCRAGTENVPGVVGLGVAAELAARELDAELPRLRALRDRLQARLADGCPDAVFHGHPEQRLPNTCSVGFPGRDAGRLLAALGDRVALSAGAACRAAGQTPRSHVLDAMGVPPAVAAGTLRLSLGRFTTEADVDRGADAVLAAVNAQS